MHHAVGCLGSLSRGAHSAAGGGAMPKQMKPSSRETAKRVAANAWKPMPVPEHFLSAIAAQSLEALALAASFGLPLPTSRQKETH